LDFVSFGTFWSGFVPLVRTGADSFWIMLAFSRVDIFKSESKPEKGGDLCGRWKQTPEKAINKTLKLATPNGRISIGKLNS
jgi:hypothetical protein